MYKITFVNKNTSLLLTNTHLMRRLIITAFLAFHCFTSFAQGAFEGKYLVYPIEENKYAFTDYQFNFKLKLGIWDKVERHGVGPFAVVWSNEKKYYLDTLGNAYLVSRKLEDKPSPDIQALDLSGQKLDTFPMEVLKYPNLRVLHIRGYGTALNKFVSLPNELTQLKALRYLFLSYGRLSALPNNIGQLQSLKYLDLRGNQLTQLPESFGQLKNLEKLDLAFSKLSKLPQNFGQLQKLVHLDLKSNQLSELPDSFVQLQKLQELILYGNRLTQLPESVGQLQKLRQLKLEENQLKRLPERIGQLQK